jgi:conjugal transfer pilus assembly protein TraV
MIIIKRITLLVILLSALTGCSTFNEQYDCPLKNGASCISLRDMDQAITNAMTGSDFSKGPNSVFVSYKGHMPQSYPKRTKSTVAKIWLAPYEDSMGNYHDSSYLYTVVNDEEWVGTPVQPSKEEKKDRV